MIGVIMRDSGARPKMRRSDMDPLTTTESSIVAPWGRRAKVFEIAAGFSVASSAVCFARNASWADQSLGSLRSIIRDRLWQQCFPVSRT
jgi:hypothetical protein